MKPNSSCLSSLNGKTFVLELSRDIRFKAKQELINYLREQNVNISYILTASTDYVLVSNDIDTYKTRRAKQLGIPLVNVEYIYEYRNLSIGKEPIDIKKFIVTSAEDKENFSKSGTISVSGGNLSSSITKPVKYDVSKIKIWNSDDVELPEFDELTHAEIAKWAIFKETNENSDVYFVLELQVIPEEYHQINRLRFRYEKQIITSLKGKNSLIQYGFSNDINELQQLYASYYNRIATMPRITRIRDLLPDKLGSKLLLRSLFLHRIDTQMLDDNVCQLIESLWIESIGDLNKILSVQPETIELKTIIQAEAALLEIKFDSKSASEAEQRFYSLIPHRQSFIVDLINNRRALIDKTDLCQMLRDMVTVNELTNWNIKASIEAKYRALKCHIETLKHDTHEYATICEMISSSTNKNDNVIVHDVYSIAKQTDALNFRSTLFNQRQLFHGSKFNNFLGILSRGLLMPKMVVNDLGITRTDIGCLGYGIYFSDSVSTSLKYTTSSTTRPGRRLLCISQVALGDSAKFYSYSTNLIQPPENFHSTHGVKKTDENNSKFVDDEYVIYNLDQQRLLYIVELSWIPHDNHNQTFNLLPIIHDQSLTNRTIVSKDEVTIPSTIEDEVIQIAEQDYGLICPSSGELVPLKAFHIRAQLVDVTAEVVLYQIYHNRSSIPIEAKYVFPLDENCSVCGFEAHINNKIIKGVVKEKEQAKREYREAIEKGHGAYLMHQEQPEVFSVSVGNLPANCEVIIKITYVAELPIENNDIIFRLPAKVASWQSKQALEIKDQTIVPSINLEQDNLSMKSVEFSLKTSIRMPYEIVKLFSPTHRLRRKITDCIAMIELVDNILLEKDFILSITLKTANLPRMLNETYDLSNENSQSCMLTFYPKFEMNKNLNEYMEIVFIIDVSNSMDGNHVQQAKQLAHLFLTNMKYDDGNIYFNIVTFGSDNDECFPISLPNTKENIDKAKHFVLHSLDHRGNTDLFSVLRRYSLCPSSSKLGRQFILLSDGHINDLKSILILLENHSSMHHDRLFTCSIGDTSNKHNLKQLSNQANGGGLTTVFDSNYRSKWKTKVLQILEHIQQPCVTNISIDWHGTINNEQEKFTDQAPKIIRSLFNGMRLSVYRFIQNCHKATLTATINNQEFVTSVFSNKITETKGRILHCLTARSIIQDYENGLLDNDESENELIKKQYKQDLIELSMKYSVVSSFTSFVAIEERDGEPLQPGVRLLDVMLENDIDLLPYIGWDGDRSQIDLLKEKLINGKRLFDSASITNKIQLTNEYENLCQNISYRSGGDAKYELMLTIIDTYQTILKEKDKARELKEKMKEDLINEIKNSTAEEKNILEKRLNEINTLLMREELKESDGKMTNFDELEAWLDKDPTATDAVSEDSGDDSDLFIRHHSIKQAAYRSAPSVDSVSYADEDEEEEEYHATFETALLKSSCDRKEKKAADSEESDGLEGFDLFGDDDNIELQTAGLTLEACAASSTKKMTKRSSPESDSEVGDAAMGFGLFDDDGSESFLASFKKQTKSVYKAAAAISAKSEAKKASPVSESEDEGDEMGCGLFDDLDDYASVSYSLASFTEEKNSVYEPRTYVQEESLSIHQAASLADSPKVSSTIKENISSELEQQKNKDLVFADAFSADLLNTCSNVILPDTRAIKKDVALKAVKPKASSQLQQQQQQMLNQSLYSPTSPSYMATTVNRRSSLTSTTFKPQMKQTNVYSSAHVPQAQLFDLPIPTTNTSMSTGFGGSPSSLTATPIPPPPPPSFSFGSSGNNNNNTFSVNSSTSAGFGALSSGRAPPPPPPPPPPPSMFYSGFFGSSSSTISSLFAAPSSTQPSLPNSSLFGSSSSTTSNVFGMQATQSTSGGTSIFPPGAPAPPPPPLPPSFSFGSSGNNNNNFFSVDSSTSAVFGALSSDRAPAPPPPPPLPPSFSFGSSENNNNNFFRVASSTSAGFGTLSSGNALPPLPPPPPPPPSMFNSGLFGSSSSTTSSSFPAQPPTQPSLSNSSLFGSSSSTTTSNVFGMQAVPTIFNTLPTYMPPPSEVHRQPTLLPPQLGATPFSFGTTTSSIQPQTVSFGADSTGTTADAVPLTNYSQSIFAAPTVLPPPRMTFQPSSVLLPPPPMIPQPPSVVPPPAPPLLASLATLSDTSEKQQTSSMLGLSSTLSSMKTKAGKVLGLKHSSDDNSDNILTNSFKSAGRGRGGFSARVQMQKAVHEFDRDMALQTKVQDTVSESTMQSMRFTDTRCDERTLPQLKISPISAALADESAVIVRKKKKKVKEGGVRESKPPIQSGKVILQDLLLLDVTPLSLGVEDINGHMCTIISRNRTIPSKTQYYSVFTNAYAYQTTVTIRVFRGEHKLTKYNTFIGEFTLTDLTPNFASQTLQISICMDIDANGLLEVAAEESRSSAKAKIKIDPNNYPLNQNDIEQHLKYVESNPDFRASHVADRSSNDPLYMLGGETENTKVNFTNTIEVSEGLPILEISGDVSLILTTINEIKRIQLSDGSFDLNQDFANLLLIDINKFDEIKKYLSKQGFNSFALNIQNEIIHLIATGIFLIEIFHQIPGSQRRTYLVPFDHEKIRTILHLHLPKLLLENTDKAIQFYEQKRLGVGIYCEQLELNYSSWEKFIQYSLFHIDN